MSVCRVGYEYLTVDKWPLLFCCTHDTEILNIVSKVAFDHHVRVWHNTCNGDIMGIPCTIAVINRSLLGEGAWENYVDWQKELDNPDATLFIYVDRDPYKEESFPQKKKSFHKDFRGDYQDLYKFLDEKVQNLVRERC